MRMLGIADSHDASAGTLDPVPCSGCWTSGGWLFACCDHSTRGLGCGDVFTAPFTEAWDRARVKPFRRTSLRDRRGDPIRGGGGHEALALERAFRAAGRGLPR